MSSWEWVALVIFAVVGGAALATLVAVLLVVAVDMWRERRERRER